MIGEVLSFAHDYYDILYLFSIRRAYLACITGLEKTGASIEDYVQLAMCAGRIARCEGTIPMGASDIVFKLQCPGFTANERIRSSTSQPAAKDDIQVPTSFGGDANPRANSARQKTNPRKSGRTSADLFTLCVIGPSSDEAGPPSQQLHRVNTTTRRIGFLSTAQCGSLGAGISLNIGGGSFSIIIYDHIHPTIPRKIPLHPFV